MASLNKVILIGNLGADPELRYVGNDTKAVCNLRVATSETWRDKSGEKKEKTEWHRISTWGELAENCNKYLGKGGRVYVEGKLATRSYDKDGSTHYSTDIVADKVLFLNGPAKEEKTPAKKGRKGNKSQNNEGGTPPGYDEDIPF